MPLPHEYGARAWALLLRLGLCGNSSSRIRDGGIYEDPIVQGGRTLVRPPSSIFSPVTPYRMGVVRCQLLLRSPHAAPGIKEEQ